MVLHNNLYSSMKLYLNERPRAFIVVSGNMALVLRHPFPKYVNKSYRNQRDNTPADPNHIDSNVSKVIVEFVNREFIDLSKYKDVTPRNGKLLGFLGLLNIKKHVFIGFITQEKFVALPVLDEHVNQIQGVEFFCLNSDAFDHENFNMIHQDEFGQPIQPQYRDKAGSVRKLLSDGSFYYSRQFDITLNLQERGIDAKPSFTLYADTANCRNFWWNKFMNRELVEFRNKLSSDEQHLFDLLGFLVTVTRGYARSLNTVIGDQQALITLISKQGCSKKGPIFGSWGCDDDGNVANYLESEIIVYTEKFILAWVVIRGNVPLFYLIETSTMKRNLITTQRIKKLNLDRLFDVCHHACLRHFEKLSNTFGEVHVLNVISPSTQKSYKVELRDEFKQHVGYLNHDKLREFGAATELTKQGSTDIEVDALKAHAPYVVNYTEIPVSSSIIRKYGYSTSTPFELVPLFERDMIDFGALFYSRPSQEFIGKQLGVFRVTSYNSMDKSNFVEKMLGQSVLELAFEDLGISIDLDILIKHAQLWQEHNEYIDKIITSFSLGTDKIHHQSHKHILSVKSHFKKKLPISTKTMSSNELAMLKLLGRLQEQVTVTLHNPIHDYVDKELKRYQSRYSYYKDIYLFCSTFNVNGTCYDGPLDEWLFPPKYHIDRSYDIVFIGIQEIIELSAGKMVNVDARNKRFWEKHIKKTLDKCNPENCTYVSLWSGQMGGIALFLFVKNSEVKNIHNVEGCFKKTGLGGMSANKGGVGISFNFSNTHVCFVSAHLAAGHSNVVERHHNYKTLAKGIQFSKNRKVRDHDVVVWLGDFNYRINLSNEDTKRLIKKMDYSKLFEFDQLNQEMANGESFPFYNEMEIKFPPTYKFDNGTNRYDTSEKNRIPAWTDRIVSLSKELRVKQLVYDCDPELMFSDHRPVYALFNLSVNVINETTKKAIYKELLDSFRQKHGGIEDILTDTNMMYLFEDSLPPPSSEKTKWWLEGHKAVKIVIPELQNPNMVMNPSHPINPFEAAVEPEFIDKFLL